MPETKEQILELIRKSISKNVENDFIDGFTPEFQEEAIQGMYEDLKHLFVSEYN